jgi:hypothetical protein
MTEVTNKRLWETHSGNPDSKEGLSLDSTPAVRKTSFHLIDNISSFTFMQWCVNFHFVQTKPAVYVPVTPWVATSKGEKANNFVDGCRRFTRINYLEL